MKIEDNRIEERLLSNKHLEGMFRRKSLLEDAAKSETNLTAFARDRGVNPSTIYRLKKREAKGMSNLVDGRSHNKGRPVRIDERAISWTLANLAAHPKMKTRALWKRTVEEAEKQGWHKPSYRQLLRLRRKMPGDMVTFLTNGARAAFEHDMLVARHQYSYPNEVWEMDSTELDLWVIDPASGKLYKPWATIIVDCFSRCVLNVEFHRSTPTAADALVALKRAILPKNNANHPFYGLPAHLQVDNHPIFMSADFMDALARLGVIWKEIPRACPSANGSVERYNRSFKESFLASLTGYAGQHAGLAKAEHAAIPAPLLPELKDKYLLEYHLSKHRGIGTEPWQQWHDHLDKAHGLSVNAEAVADAIKIRKEYTFQRDGIELEPRRHFTHPKMAGLVGEKIVVRVDPEGSPQSAEAYHKGKFIATLHCVEENPDVADNINKDRLNRTIEFKRFRKRMRKALKENGVAQPLQEPKKKPSVYLEADKKPKRRVRKITRIPKLKPEENV